MGALYRIRKNLLEFGWQTSAMDESNESGWGCKNNKPINSSTLVCYFCILSYFNMLSYSIPFSKMGLRWWMVFATVVTLPSPSISHRHLHPRSEAGFKHQRLKGLRASVPILVQRVLRKKIRANPEEWFHTKGVHSVVYGCIGQVYSFDSGFRKLPGVSPLCF